MSKLNFHYALLCGSIVTINSLYRTDEIGDGEEDKTIEPFAGLHKAEEHKITVTAIYFEWFYIPGHTYHNTE